MATKTAYVTGGASGIGRAVVNMLVRRGIRVAIGDRDFAGAQSAVANAPGAIALDVDVADWDSQLKAFQQVLLEFGRLDYVYSIAGIGEKTWIPNDRHVVEFVKPNLGVLEVDLNGVLFTSALAIQQMRRQIPDETGFRGKITVAASVCGFYCVPTLPIYTAAKHGVVGFVRSYGKYLPAESITLNAICPNVVRTNISTANFYDQMESRDLLVPMSKVVEAFERCLDESISGETLEIEPHSDITHQSAPEPFDKHTSDTLALLHARGAPLHEPRAPEPEITFVM